MLPWKGNFPGKNELKRKCLSESINRLKNAFCDDNCIITLTPADSKDLLFYITDTDTLYTSMLLWKLYTLTDIYGLQRGHSSFPVEMH